MKKVYLILLSILFAIISCNNEEKLGIKDKNITTSNLSSGIEKFSGKYNLSATLKASRDYIFIYENGDVFLKLGTTEEYFKKEWVNKDKESDTIYTFSTYKVDFSTSDNVSLSKGNSTIYSGLKDSAPFTPPDLGIKQFSGRYVSSEESIPLISINSDGSIFMVEDNYGLDFAKDTIKSESKFKYYFYNYTIDILSSENKIKLTSSSLKTPIILTKKSFTKRTPITNFVGEYRDKTADYRFVVIHKDGSINMLVRSDRPEEHIFEKEVIKQISDNEYTFSPNPIYEGIQILEIVDSGNTIKLMFTDPHTYWYLSKVR